MNRRLLVLFGAAAMVGAFLFQSYVAKVGAAELSPFEVFFATITGSAADGSDRPVACVAPPSGMVAWYPGDGNAHDISPDSNNNGYQGTQTAFTAGKVAQAFQFNGAAQSAITVPDSPSLHATTALTIDAWINPATGNSTGLQSVVFKGNPNSLAGQPYSVFIDVVNSTTYRVNFRIGNSSTADAVESTTPLSTNTYTHFAGTYDGTTIRIYINGVLEASKTSTIGALDTSNTQSMLIGSYIGSYTGTVDELEIFNRALSQPEIQSIVNADSSGKCKPTVPAAATSCTPPPATLNAWLPGDGNANDISGNGNNGTLGGQTTFVAGKVLQAFQFNGNPASSVTVPDSNSLRATNALTIDAWINPSSNAGDPFFKGCFSVGNCQPYGLLMTPFTATSSQVIFSIGSDTTFDRLGSGSPIPLNTYTHITGTYDGTTMRLYVNGLLDSSKTTAIGTLNQTNTTDPLRIGQGPDGVFTGGIDEIEILKRTLSATEVYNIYNAGTFGKCKPGAATPTPYSDSHANCNPDANSDTYSNADSHADTNPNGDGDANTYADRDTYSNADSHSNTYADCNADADSDTNCHTDANTYSDADGYADTNTDGHAYTDADSNTDGYADADTDGHADSNTDAD